MLFEFFVLVLIYIAARFWWAQRKKQKQKQKQTTAQDYVRIPEERLEKVLSTKSNIGGQRSQAGQGSSSKHSAEIKFASSSSSVSTSGSTEELVPDEVLETVSVILRRQVPIREEEPSRSWFGGLPMIPENLPWPQSVSSEYPDKGERPLHFLAQICCADFPEELWSGLGPRDGWLLFFLDPNTCELEGKGDYKILHTLELGVERKPPSNIGPVYDGVYAGPNYDYLRATGEIPNTWRRWPLDFVTVPNEVFQEDVKLRVTPDNFAQELYKGSYVSSERQPPRPKAFTWQMVLAVLHQIEMRLVKHPVPSEISEKVLAILRDPEKLVTLKPNIPELLARIETSRKNLAAEEKESGDSLQARTEYHALMSMQNSLESSKRKAELLDRYASIDSLANYQLQAGEAFEAWRGKALRLIRAEKERVSREDPASTLDDGEWKSILNRLAEPSIIYWEFNETNWPRPLNKKYHEVAMVETQLSSSSLYDAGTARLSDFAADYYCDPDLRRVIPEVELKYLEPYWRNLVQNRPHRIGGEFDALQSNPKAGPTSRLTLLHLASDNAMNWTWGDGGIVYFKISPQNLAAGRFDEAFALLECF
jgi:uncharacterized protein DUF1963